MAYVLTKILNDFDNINVVKSKVYYTGKNTIIENGLHIGVSENKKNAIKYATKDEAEKENQNLLKMSTFKIDKGFSAEKC